MYALLRTSSKSYMMVSNKVLGPNFTPREDTGDDTRDFDSSSIFSTATYCQDQAEITTLLC